MALWPLLVLALAQLPPPLCEGKTGHGYDPSQDKEPRPRAVAEVQLAYDVLCPDHKCGTGRLVQNRTVGMNALTWVSGIRHKERTRAKIVYSADFLNGLNQRFGPGASYGVLAHEVGHHLTAALSLRSLFESSWSEELRADYLAGCALGRAGRPSKELENALKALAKTASPSHPSFRARNPVIRRGFNECKRQALDVAKRRKPFGLGNKSQTSSGCWRYWYRLKTDLEILGPVAAPARQSSGFESFEYCESHRELRGDRSSVGCLCKERRTVFQETKID